VKESFQFNEVETSKVQNDETGLNNIILKLGKMGDEPAEEPEEADVTQVNE